MWQRFDVDARKAVFYAQEEAGKRGQNEVGPEHLLLGILRIDTCTAVTLLTRLNLKPEAILAEIDGLMQPGSGHLSKDRKLTTGGKQVIDLAYSEARLLGHNYIGTEHLLLGIIGDAKNIGAKALVDHKVTLNAVRQELVTYRELNPAPIPPSIWRRWIDRLKEARQRRRT